MIRNGLPNRAAPRSVAAGFYKAGANHEQGVELCETPRRMVARLGLEPRLTESESAVLPLHHQAIGMLEVRPRRAVGQG